MKVLALITTVVALFVACGGSTPASPPTEAPPVETLGGVEATRPGSTSTEMTAPVTRGSESTTTAVVVGPQVPTQPLAPSTTIDPVIEQIISGLPMPAPTTVALMIPPTPPPPIYNPPMSTP